MCKRFDPGICTIHRYLAIFLSAGTLQPSLGKGLPEKHHALSLMKEKSPIMQTSPDRTCSPVPVPVRMETPANAATYPMVGANCHGGITEDAIGWLKLWAC